jgi:hypothetical protein
VFGDGGDFLVRQLGKGDAVFERQHRRTSRQTDTSLAMPMVRLDLHQPGTRHHRIVLI